MTYKSSAGVTITLETPQTKYKRGGYSSGLSLTFLVQPQDIIADEFDTITFSCEVNSKEPLIYQWYKNGVIAVDSSNSNSYSTTVYSSDNESTFKVIVTSANKGNIESVSASLTVNDVSFYWSEPFLWS